MIQRKRRVWVSGLACICLGLISRAQSPELPKDIPVLVENAPDSSAGFSRLQKRFVALPKGARPVSVLAVKGEWLGGMHGVTIPKNWVAGEEKELNALYAYLTVRSDSIRKVKMTKEHGFSINFDMNDVDFVVGEIDLNENIRDIFELLTSTDKNKKWEQKRFLRQYGELMLYAARLHELGYNDPANQLAAYLFETYSKRETVLRALSTLADEEYLDQLAAFSQNKDAGKFITEVKASLEKHQTYWVIAPSLREKVAEWEKNISLTKGSIPGDGGDKLSEAQKILYAKFMEDPESLLLICEILEDENWLLQPNSLVSEFTNYYLEEDEGAPLVEEAMKMLKTSRQDFLNFCEVMLHDPRLVPYVDAFSSEAVEYGDNGEMPSFPEPYQIRNLAAIMLTGLAPDDQYWDSEEPEELLSMLKIFRAKTDEMDKTTLAKYYLDGRDGNYLPREAIYTLLSSKDPDIRKETIDVMLQDQDHMDDALLILLDFQNYHPEESEAGLNKILAQLKTLDPDDAWEFGGPEGLKSNISTIENLLGLQPEEPVETPTFSEALDQWIATGDPDKVQTVISTLQGNKSINQNDVQKILADRIQSQPLVAARFLLNLQDMIIRSGGLNELQLNMYGSHEERMKYYVNPEIIDGSDGNLESLASSLVWDKEIWLPLLNASETYEQKRKAFMIAFAIVNPIQDATEQSDAHYRFSHLFKGKDNPADLLLVSWAKRYLENPEDLSWLKEVPNPDNLDEVKLQEIQKTLSGQDLPAAQALLNAEDIEERLAALLASESDEAIAGNTALWTSQLERKNQITLINPLANKEDPILEGIEVGELLTFETVNEIIKGARAEALKGKRGLLAIRTTMLNQGVSLIHSQSFISEGYFQKPGIRIYGVTQDLRVSGEFPLNLDLQLKRPADGEKKELNILELIAAGENQQLESLSSAVHDWITTPVPPHKSGGQLTIIYCGEKSGEPEE